MAAGLARLPAMFTTRDGHSCNKATNSKPLSMIVLLVCVYSLQFKPLRHQSLRPDDPPNNPPAVWSALWSIDRIHLSHWIAPYPVRLVTSGRGKCLCDSNGEIMLLTRFIWIVGRVYTSSPISCPGFAARRLLTTDRPPALKSYSSFPSFPIQRLIR